MACIAHPGNDSVATAWCWTVAGRFLKRTARLGSASLWHARWLLPLVGIASGALNDTPDRSDALCPGFRSGVLGNGACPRASATDELPVRVCRPTRHPMKLACRSVPMAVSLHSSRARPSCLTTQTA